MCEISTADGFVEINENLGDMIKYVANEPSVGLYYIQQHAQTAVPNVVRLKNNVMEKSHEVSLHTEDLEDSVAMTKSMKECGFSIIDDMLRDIKTSLTIMSTKQPVRGVIQHRNSSYQMSGPTSSWGPVTWARSAVSVQGSDDERGRSYFSNVFKKAGNLKWGQLKEMGDSSVGGDLSSYDGDRRLSAPVSSSSTQPDESDELPVSSQVQDEMANGDNVATKGKPRPLLPPSNDFDEFKADREARLEEWLKGSSSIVQKGTGDAQGSHLLDSL